MIQTHNIDSINEWQINTVVDNVNKTSLKAYIQKNKKFEACIITQILGEIETVFTLDKNYPRLYYTFPLIGTEEIGIPIIINSAHFDPRVERDGIYLTKESENGEINKEIINKALSISLQAFAELFKTKNICGIYKLFDFKLSKDLKWVDREWFKPLKSREN